MLCNQLAMPTPVATAVTAHFLKTFRQCPDRVDTPLDEWRQHLWREALPPAHRHLAIDIHQQWLDLRFRYLALTPDIVALLQSLRQRYLLAIITNGPSAAQWEKVQRLAVAKYFDCVLVSGDMPWEKPSPQIFTAACRYLGVEPRQCVMIGDKIETDIQVGNTFWAGHIGVW